MENNPVNGIMHNVVGKWQLGLGYKFTVKDVGKQAI